MRNKSKRTTIRSHFDNPRQVSEITGPRPGEVELLLRDDERQAAQEEAAIARTLHKKRVFDFVREFPGCTLNEIRQKIGSVSGIKEWEADGILVRRNGRFYFDS
jgi:hypothetical protein